MWRQGTTSAAGRVSASFAKRRTTSWIWIEKLRSYYAGIKPRSPQPPAPTELIDHSIFTFCRGSNYFHVAVILHLVTVVITSSATIKCVRDGIKAGSELKVITEAFLRTLPLRISLPLPGSSQYFCEFADERSSPFLVHSLTQMQAVRIVEQNHTQCGLHFLTQSESRTLEAQRPVFVFKGDL